MTATALSAFFEDRNNRRYDDQLTQAGVPFANTPDHPSGGWRVQLFARNVFDKQVISGFALTSDALGWCGTSTCSIRACLES